MKFINSPTFKKEKMLPVSEEDIRLLPQFFRADINFVYKFGGSVYRDFLSKIEIDSAFKYYSIDSRSHMLMKKMYPCIPGWHCDDFYRPNGRQPDLKNIPKMRHHAVVLGDCSLTEFITTSLNLIDPNNLDQSIPLYGQYDDIVNHTSDLFFQVAESHQIVEFGPLDMHRGSAAAKNGWRHFIRITESDHWAPVNEIRHQTQVYLTEPFYGW